MSISVACGKVIEVVSEFLSLRNLMKAYFVINSIGLIVISMLVAIFLAKTFQPPMHVYASLYPWARPPVGSEGKLSTLLQYIFPVLTLFIYYAIYLRVSKYVTGLLEGFDKNRLQKIGFYFLTALVINCVLFFIGKEHRLILGLLSILWLLLFLWAPYSVYKNRPLNIPISSSIVIPSWIWGVALCIIIVQYAVIFAPLVINSAVVGNDYINFSEKTILKSGRVVDNVDYINSHKVAGLHLYDPRHRLGVEGFAKDNLDFLDHQNGTYNNSISSSVESLDFIAKNKRELLNQTKAGWFFYHHGYNFGPMNALSLGASPYQQTMVYGWLSTVSQGKLLEFLGASSYQGYFKLYFAEYIAYFVIFLLGIWAIFKRLGTVVFAAILAISALFFLGIELIQLAPGFNPVRHFFDILVFYLLYRYLELGRKSYLILGSILALFAILWSKDFGLFLTISVGGALLFKGVKQRQFQLLPLFMGVVIVIAGVLVYFYPMPGANPTAIYMLLGVGSPQAASGAIFGLLVIISLLLAATITIKQSEVYTVLSVGVAFYFVQSLTYYIWYPALHHILGVAPVFILWLAVIFHGWISQSKSGEKLQSAILLSVLILVYLPASIIFYWGVHTYNQTFRNHQLYNWQFDKARLVSTMEPTLFEDAVNLIKRYSANSNGIFIVSKYDHILPILAGKYSAMPYNELPTNLASPREVQVASDAILKNKPAFIFVDSDIGRNLNGEIPIENDPVTIQLGLYGEARARAMVLQGLNDVYVRLVNTYTQCEVGRLISVYCRNP